MSAQMGGLREDVCPMCFAPESRCQCTEPEREYGMVREAVMECLNPPDDDAAEVSILIRAIEDAKGFIEGQPCSCDVPDGPPCERCAVLGRFDDKRVER